VPNNLLFVAIGAGILWLGWNGFNGGDPYFAGADATAAVVNTNLATACAMMTWIIMDMALGKEKKPTFLGGVNGMICGLVGITPAAGYVNGLGAIVIGVFTSAVVWALFGYLPRKVWPFNKVDDALGVVYTHGFAGLCGGLLVGLFADPNMIVYLGLGKQANVTTAGAFYGHPKQLLWQAGAALTVIIWDGLVTFLILRGIGLFMKLRMPDAELVAGDIAVHGEVAYPNEEPDVEPAFGDIPGEPVPEPHRHHEKVLTEERRASLRVGADPVSPDAEQAPQAGDPRSPEIWPGRPRTGRRGGPGPLPGGGTHARGRPTGPARSTRPTQPAQSVI